MQENDSTEEDELRSVALRNANAILLARRRAEQELLSAQQALRETSERLQLALSAGHLGDWRWDARTDAVSLSARAADIFGLPHETPITWTRMRELLHEEDRERARLAVEKAISGRTDYAIEYRVNLPAGGQCWIAASGRATYAPDGAVLGMTGVVQDITERKDAEEERRQLLESERAARAQAERANAMKDEFLATLSHELRTPLSAILGWAQVLQRGGRSESEVKQGLETIERNARMQTQLIEDLLDMSRIISGKLRLDLQTLEPVPFIEAALETVTPAAEAREVRLEKLLDPSAGPIAGDANRLQQVVWNLLSNAIKFTPKGGKVQVLLERVNSNIEISVADTGIGIAPPFLPHVFERFRQADASTTRNFGGLGLGLSIVKDLVELHGGTVHVRSPGEGLGTTFVVRLPLVSGS